MSEAKPDNQRNLNPHKPARVAMILWNERYAAQRGGSMDFWDELTASEQEICREILRDFNERGRSMSESEAAVPSIESGQQL